MAPGERYVCSATVLAKTRENLAGVAGPAVVLVIVLQEGLEMGPRELGLAEGVFRHAGVVERHVVIGPVVHHQLHDRSGGLVVAGVSHWMSDLEDNARRLGPF